MIRCFYLLFVIIFGLIAIIGVGCGGGGGDGGGNGGDGGGDGGGSSSDGTQVLRLDVILGPIVGGTVNVYPLTDMSNLLGSGITEDSDDIDEAGRVDLTIPEGYDETPLYVTVEGGVDIDADDDGNRDTEPTDNDITLKFVFPTPDDIEDLQIVANPLLIFASEYVLENVWNDYETITDPEEVRMIMELVAKALIWNDFDNDGEVDQDEDVKVDGVIDWKDIVSFNPLEDSGKSIIPWNYVLDNIERTRSNNYSRLIVYYLYTYTLDPLNQEPFDINEDGDFEESYRLAINFHSDKKDINGNQYTLQDLLNGQGEHGGSVDLPGDSTLTYVWHEYDENGQRIEYTVENDPEPPLWIYQTEDAEKYPIRDTTIGGFSSNKEAPVGEYYVTYTTGDGIEHEEKLYVHESRSQSLYYPFPEFEIDQDGFVESLTLRFEDGDGNAIEEPPVLGLSYYIAMWEEVDQVNSLVRGENYYEAVAGGDDVYKYSANILSLTTPYYPTNNGHKIYYEDIKKIEIFSGGGDGVNRTSFFHLNRAALFPQISNSDVSGNTVTVEYSPSDSTNRDVESIKYKFDNGEWAEVAGSTLTKNIPAGATILYTTAADSSGFYRYPPEEIDLTQ